MLDMVLALLPILLFVVLLTAMRVPAPLSALSGLICAVAVGVLRFDAGAGVIVWEGVKGSWSAFTIFTVIAPAVLIYELLRKSGMFEQIKYKVEFAIHDDLLRVLFIGWVFTSFLQSITGFGVPVAVAAPILVSLGVKPLRSVVICILGHAWGGTFGTLAIAWDSLFLQVPEAASYAGVTLSACLMLWVYNLLCGVAICALHKGKRVCGRDIAAVLFISTLQGGGQLLFAGWAPSTACFLASTLAVGGVLLLNRYLYPAGSSERSRDGIKTWHLLFPFLVLTLLVAATLFIPPVHTALGAWRVGFTLPADLGGGLYAPISPLTHSGTLLLAAGLISLCFFWRQGYLDGPKIGAALRATLQKACASIVPILFLIVMSKVMDGTGQIAVLAEGIAGLLGGAYPVFAPYVGILGAFISSSNMSSNLLFAGFQNEVARLLAIHPGAILAAQTVGGSIGNLIATSNIVLGLATTAENGKEGQVMRAMLPIALVCGAVCGLMTLAICLLQ